MGKTIKQISLGLENCEVIDFPSNQIGKFYLTNITNSIHRFGSIDIQDYKECDEFFVELLPCANKVYHPFGDVTSEATTFKRLQSCNDIVDCEVTYQDGSKEDIHIPWDDETGCDEINGLQSSYLSANGALYIYVGRNGTVEGKIDCDEVDSEEYKRDLDIEYP